MRSSFFASHIDLILQCLCRPDQASRSQPLLINPKHRVTHFHPVSVATASPMAPPSLRWWLSKCTQETTWLKITWTHKNANAGPSRLIRAIRFRSGHRHLIWSQSLCVQKEPLNYSIRILCKHLHSLSYEVPWKGVEISLGRNNHDFLQKIDSSKVLWLSCFND